MGKKISPASLMKISKNHDHKHHQHQQKKQLNSLIEVLRPKVYITDSSSFKSLVQQLTGLDGATAIASSSSSPPPVPLQPQTQLDHHGHHEISIIHIDDHDHYLHPDHDESNSMEAATSSDYASVDSFEHVIRFNQLLPVSLTEEVNQLPYDQMFSECLFTNQQQDQEEGFWENHGAESWLFNMEEPCPNNISYNNGYYSQQIIHQQEVSIYDYELSGLI